jgi:hypothetical protein
VHDDAPVGRRLAVIVLLAVAAPACRGATEVAAVHESAPATTTSTSIARTTTTTDVEVEVDAADDQAVSIHVEGTIPYERHRATIDALADEAAAAGIPLSFELSRQFTEGSLAAGDGFVASLAERGHGVGVHADLGFPAQPPAVFTRRLAEHKALVERALGAPVTVVSGICSSAPWVESAIAAGFEIVTGTVEYCLMSTDRAPACASPADCHDPLPADPSTDPWRTSSSADWLTPDPDGAIWIVPSQHVLAVGAIPPPDFVAGLATRDGVSWVPLADLVR